MRYLTYLLIICALGAAVSHRQQLIDRLPPTLQAYVPSVLKQAPQIVPTGGPQGQLVTLNQSLPSFTLQPTDGISSSLSSGMMRGQLTMVTFFAGWCGYCKAQMPIQQQLKQQYPHIRMIGVIYKDTPAHARAMLTRYGNPFDAIYTDPDQRAAKALHVSGVPNNYIIDRNGLLQYRYPGSIMNAQAISATFIPLFNQLETAKR